MLKQLKMLFISSLLFTLSACGLQFQNGGLIPPALQTLTLESSDPYSEMAIVLRKQLQRHNIELVDAQQNIPVLRLNKVSTSDKVASIFKHGREAEKMLFLEVEASVKLPNNHVFPISTQVNRTFFDNSRAALAKSAEKDVIWNDMREQAARQLISKMVALQHQVQSQ
ncbi:LPS assembly lipoprotein LptE [Pasteurella sp. PK-2025]|uniref:LPS-assembly lipoprotein LptE n=1 Tax=unclassified Pasteurella TaxID=2621516 RepID=UPI003C7764B7